MGNAHFLRQKKEEICEDSGYCRDKWTIYVIIYILVGGFNHLEKYESQWEGLSHILWKIKIMFETTNQYILWSIKGILSNKWGESAPNCHWRFQVKP